LEILSISEVTRIELELTNTCNLKCPLCFRNTHPENIPNIKYRDLEDIIFQLEQYNNLKYITLAGPNSEPTLYPYLFELIEYLKLRSIEISIFINGETHDDLFYKKLGLTLRDKELSHKIYFTICGSTQELHEKYRVNSSLKKVLRNLDNALKFNPNVILTWIVFEYNQDDYLENKNKFKKYNLEVFYTLPIAEHFNLESYKKEGICLPKEQQKAYENIDKYDTNNIRCPALDYKFHLISSDGTVSNCSLHKIYGDKRCFECSAKNLAILENNKIYHIAEPESEISEVGLRLYDNN
jgi:MoaA/NifB/PqqE/SkfB family radical SAM enzyme